MQSLHFQSDCSPFNPLTFGKQHPLSYIWTTLCGSVLQQAMPCKRQKRGAPQRCTCHPILKQPWSANKIRNDVSKPLKAAKVCYCHVSWDAGCTHNIRIYEIMHMDYTWRSQCWGRVSKTHKECKAPNRSLPSRFKFIIVDPCLSTPLLAQQLHLLPKSLWWGSFLQRYPWNSRPTWPARRCHRLLLFPL